MHDAVGKSAAAQAGDHGSSITGTTSVAGPLSLGEAHYRAIFESASDFAILTTDLDGAITSWNSGAEKLLGWSESEAVGQHGCMIFTAEDRAKGACLAEMHDAAEHGRAEDERWHLRRDGSVFWASGLMMRFEDEKTRAHVGYLKILRDRTAQHGADERLREAQELARALFESSADCVKILDLEGRLHSMNGPGLCVMEIDDFTAFAGRDWATLWPEALRDEVRQAVADAKAGRLGRYYGLCPTAKGTPKWWDVQVSPVLGADGAPRMLLSVSRDMTERAEGQHALGESEARFRNLADHAPLMMWVTGPDGQCTYLNRRWHEFTGHTEQEALGLGWTRATHPDDQAMAQEALRAAVAAQRPYRIEFRLRRADGVYRWAIDAAAPRFAEDGRFLGHVGSVIDIDDRREAEDAIRQANRLLAAVMEAVPGVIYAKDRGGRMLAANRGTADLVGKPLARIIGQTDAEFLDDPAQAEAVMANDRRIMAANQTEVIEEEVSLPDGTGATWLSTKSPFRDAHGAVVGLVGSSVDISERKRAEDQLRESEARFRLMADAVPQIVWITDGRGRTEFFNKQWADYIGVQDFPPSVSAVSESYVHPDDAGRTMAAFEQAQRTGQIFEVEHRIRRHDGVYRWFLVRADPHRDERTGEIVRWFGTSVDIQDRKVSEDTLRELNDTLERRVEAAIIDRDRTWNNARDLLLVVGTDGIFRAVNPAWTQILGWLPAELVGRSYLDIIHPDDHASSQGALATAAAHDPPVYENRYRHKNGSYRWISWVAAPEDDLIYASGRDVSADKQRQAELEAAQEQLRQAQKMEAVGQLTGGIAHDFNNLLTGVIGSLDMMQRRMVMGDTEKVERYATAAMTSANRAAALTHRLLAFSRRQPLDPKPVSANRLVTGMEELLRRTIGERVRLEIVTAGGLWQTLCDPHQLESAILNLAINARDAMPDGGALTIETCNAHLDNAYAASSREVRPGQYICICVTDSGVGMTADVIAKAFDPFFTTKPIGQGTGLGLSMIYGFARQSEGYAKIYSEVGRGTTIKLYLPRYYGEGEDAEDASVARAEEHRAEHGEVVLVVEDETAVRDLVVDVLEELGYHAIEAADGPSGLKLLQSDMRIDLLVTDIGLPGLNGRQVADAARVSRPELGVLFMTGYAENATVANGFLEPGMQMITKPFAVEALTTRIRDMIERR